MQPVGIFRQTTVAHLAVAKDLLNESERVFHFGPDTGFDFLGLQLIRIQLFSSARALDNEPGNVFTMLMLSPFLDAQVTGIPEDPPLVTVQQLISGYDVVDVGGRGPSP